MITWNEKLAVSRISKALDYAKKAHKGQVRKDNKTPYIVHPVGVAKIVHENGGNDDQIIVALLHDVIEDCDGYDEERITFDHGPIIAQGVVALSDTSKVDFPKTNRAQRKEMDNARLSGIAPQWKMVKLADIWYNINDLASLEEGFIPVFLREKKASIEVLRDGNEKMYQQCREYLLAKLN